MHPALRTTRHHAPAYFGGFTQQLQQQHRGQEDDKTGTDGGTGGNGGQGGSGGGSGDPAGGGDGGDNATGFPANTPVAEMKTEEQVAYWRAQSRKHEGRYKAIGNVDELKDKASKFDAHTAASATDQEKAVADAEKRGREAATAEANVRTAAVILRAGLAARGVTGDDAKELVETTNTAAFVVNGEVDTDKVTAYVNRVTGTKPKDLDLGQGKRTPAAKKLGEAGRAEAQRRFGDKSQQK